MGLNKLMSDVSALIAAYNTKKTEIDAAVTAAQTAVLANNKNYYVDPVAGLDTNSGTQDSPFKTIRKACDSVPIGGYGTITVVGNEAVTAEITSDITLYNKSIILKSASPASRPKVRNLSYDYNGARHTTGFQMRNAIIAFSDLDIVTASWNDAALPTSTWEGVIKRFDISAAKVFFFNGRISIGDTPFIRRSAGAATIDVGTYALTLEIIGQHRSTDFAILDGMPAVLCMHQSILPAGTTWKDHIAGISHHQATGMPLNVISNIDLSLPNT